MTTGMPSLTLNLTPERRRKPRQTAAKPNTNTAELT